MTDIVEVLNTAYATRDYDLIMQIVREAAADNERLRAADKVRVTVHEAEIRRLAIECGKAKDDNERLRAALQEIAALDHKNYSAKDIARRALEPKP